MTYTADGPWWTLLPAYRVSQVTGADPQLVELALDPLPDDAPAVVRFRPVTGVSAATQVATLLDAADRAAVALFPRWLPGADRLDGPGALGTGAVRALAARVAAGSRGFGPFLTELAERALSGATTDRRPDAGTRFPAEVRAAGLVRVLADAYHRRSVVLLVRMPDGLTPADERALTAAAEWFVEHGRCAVWLTGAELRTVDRVRPVRITLPGVLTRLAAEPADSPANPTGGWSHPPDPPASTDTGPPSTPTLRVPPTSGLPRADSAAEQALERALTRHHWAYGRRWNHTLTWHTLARPYRLDLFWPVEGLVVEVDGPEHRERLRYADDRHRDAQLQLLGHDVLRFTNDQVLSDVDAVVGTIRDLLAGRRPAGVRDEETRHHVDR
ncbi:endonuclease domain-containing protein [Micromonospora sp. NPDC050187]|uniref:endonuclease domain-containing protein n=1 Tax=Micromonospora sp. NPDC050187 TaxID=3364277 RepID=UPI0037B0A4E5